MLTKEDLKRIEKALEPRFNALRDDILQVNKKVDEGFERIYRYLSDRIAHVENQGHLNAVDIDMIKHRMLLDKGDKKYRKTTWSQRDSAQQ
jgi:hypothetical protein